MFEITLSADASYNLEIVKKSKEAAREYTWLYHCTNTDSAINIIKSREMWLSNLGDVNDAEETTRIDLQSYKDKFFIACFTYDPNITPDHWKEYSKRQNGILIGFKQDWFKFEPQFIMRNGTKIDVPAISPTTQATTLRNFPIDPKIQWCVEERAFYKVIYDDELMLALQTPGWSGNYCEDEINIIIPSVAGIVKSKSGTCSHRDGTAYTKNWEEEKEVRLKIRLGQLFTTDFAPRNLSVPLTDNAFDELVLEFDPKFPETDKQKFLKQVYDLLPDGTIINSKGQKYSICDS